MTEKRGACILSSVGGQPLDRDLAESLSAHGIPTQLVYSIRDEQYRSAKRKSFPILLRGRMYLGYPVTAISRSLKWREKILISTTNPFFLPLALAKTAGIGRNKIIQWTYDVYPDALIVANTISETGILARLLTEITRQSFQKCDAIVFLGSRIAQFAQDRYGPARRASVIPLGLKSELFERPSNFDQEALTILYCGHFGKMHDTETFLKAVGLLRASSRREPAIEARFIFHASGPGIAKLKTALGDSPVGGSVRQQGMQWKCEFHPNLSEEVWRRTLPRHPIGLVTMVPGAERVIMPSKTYAAMMAGQAIIAICPVKSDLADTVLGHNAGWIVTPEGTPSIPGKDVYAGSEGLNRLIAHLLKHPEEVREKRENAMSAARKFYTFNATISKWIELISAVSADGKI